MNLHYKLNTSDYISYLNIFHDTTFKQVSNYIFIYFLLRLIIKNVIYKK